MTGIGMGAVSSPGADVPVFVVGTRGRWPEQGFSGGTDTTVNSRVAVAIPYAARSPRILYTNADTAVETPGPNAITVQGAIEYDGVNYPLTFGGASSVSIPPGGQVATDPHLSLSFAAGSTAYLRSYVSVASGEKWPLGLTYGQVGGDGYESGVGLANVVAGTGALSGNPFVYGFAPTCLLGRFISAGSSIAIIGDSIGNGTAEGNDSGFIIDAINGTVPFAQITCPGEGAGTYPTYATLRLALAGYATAAICQHGTNDIGAVDLAGMQSLWIAQWGAVLAAGVPKIYQCTIVPRTNSTDAWATTANQSAYSANYATGGTRDLANTWLRAGAPMSGGAAVAVGTVGALVAGDPGHPLRGIFDAAVHAEDSGDPNLWVANGTANYATADGLHPNGVIHQLMKTSIDLAAVIS